MRLPIGLRLGLTVLAAGLATTLAPAPVHAHGNGGGGSGRPFPAVIQLPDGFRPEGIAIRRTTAYFGSLADGDIYAADLRTGEGRVISQGPGTPSAGLDVDSRGRLFVAGASAGDARVVDTRTGAVLASYDLATTTPSFVNDVIVTKRMAWFTDSQNPVLYGLPLGKGRSLPDQADVVRLPLSGDYVHQPGFNLNGIVATARGWLLAVQSNTGLLFRIDPRTGVATAVDLGGYVLANGDGLVLVGRTLYVVQNRLNQVAVFRLNRTATAGTLERTLTNPAFDVPTTAAVLGGWLYLPNARFGTPPTPDTTYTAVRVRR